MPSEDTDLERRVLAHERILKALITQLAQDSPGFLERMNDEFGLSMGHQGYQHDYTATAEHADEFMRHVTAAAGRPPASGPTETTASDAPDDRTPAPLEERDEATTFRVAERHGIWRVTRDDVFYGDYRAARHAVDASTTAALKIEKAGRVAAILIG